VDYHLANSIAVGASRSAIVEEVSALAVKAYVDLEERIGEDIRDIERQILLYTIDHIWKAHLYEMDHLKEAIRFRGYGQRDPLSEYKQEGFVMFQQMMDRLAYEIAGRVLHIHPEQRPQFQQAQRSKAQYQELHGNGEPEEAAPPARVPVARPDSAPQLPGTRPVFAQPSATPTRLPQGPASATVGRNDPCPCGSGKKFKKCHGENL
jgi:preprotein translocase subunit SecA